MKITYWSDFVCPYCYIGEANLLKALKNTGIKAEMEMKAYQLDPQALEKSEITSVQRLANKYGMSLERAQKRAETIDNAAAQAGLKMNYADAKYVNTSTAHRLVKYAQSLGNDNIVAKLIERLFKLVFTEGKNISDKDELFKEAVGAGLTDQAEIKAVLNSDKYMLEIHNDERMAHQQGVRGVPYFIIGDYAIPGAYPVEEIERILRSVEEREAVENGKKPDGVVCDANGCNLVR